MDQKVDYIIIGQGIAGTTLAYQLIKAGKKVVVVDQHNPNSSSNVATGIINPVTGRKLVKSWMVDDLLSFAESLYKSIEKDLNIQFYNPRPIYKIFHTVKEQNEWILKCSESDYSNYLSEVEYPNWDKVDVPHGVGVIKQSAWVDLSLLISCYRSYLKENDVLVEGTVDYNEFIIQENQILYKGIESKRIVFCEGYKGRNNPYFNHLPFSFAKGEVFTVRCNDLNFPNGILSKSGQVIPLGDNLYNVGSTFKWDDLEEEISEEGLIELKKKFEKICSAKYEIIEQKTGIRPTVKDRRPFLGASPKAKNVFVFNGMGTKGISLSPYFAKHLIEHMEEGVELIKEVDIKRYAL